MYTKILIQFDLEVVTGMHIGGSSAFSAIGAVDSPVIRDALTGRPIVPGSSLKGKLRTLLARSFAGDIQKMPEFRDDHPAVLQCLHCGLHSRRVCLNDFHSESLIPKLGNLAIDQILRQLRQQGDHRRGMP